MKRIVTILILFIFCSCAFLARTPNIDPYDYGSTIENRSLYCHMTEGLESDDSKVCMPIILFEDNTVFMTTRLIQLEKISEITERNRFYEKRGESGWGRYTVNGDTLRFTYAEFFGVGGAPTYDKIEHSGIITDDKILLFSNPNLRGRFWADDKLFKKIDNVDLNFLEPQKAWINKDED